MVTWYIDPVNGSDKNVGNENSKAVKNFSQIVLRYGTSSPIIDEPTSIQWLNSSTIDDPIIFSPYLVGNGGVSFQGLMKEVGNAIIDTYTPQNPATGALNTIKAKNVSPNFWNQFVGCTVHDNTSGAQFHILSDLGNSTAVISAPKVYPILGFGQDATIVNGDSLTIFQSPLIYATYLAGLGFGNLSGGGMSLNQLNISGEGFTIINGNWMITECNVTDSTITSIHSFESSVGPSFVSCFLQTGTDGISPPFSGRGAFFGGALSGGANNFLDNSVLDGDVVLLTHIHSAGTVKFGRCYMANLPTNDNPPTTYWILPQNYGTPRLWGPAGFNVTHGSKILFSNTTAQAGLLLTGQLTLDNQNLGYPWVPNTNSYGPGISISSLAIDTNNGLSNPATGSGFIFGALS